MALAVMLLYGLAPTCADTAGNIDAAIDAQQLTVGDPFWYTVKLVMPGDSKAELPGNDVKLGQFEIRDFDQDTSSLPDGRQQITLRYQLVGFKVGESEIAGFEVKARRTKDGKEKIDRYVAPPVKVTIASVLPPQGGEMKPIYGPIFLMPWWHAWIKPALIALAALAVLVLGVWIWSRKRSRVTTETAVQVTFQEAAYGALVALRDSKLIAAGRFKQFYSELGDILRRWLEYRANIPAMEETTGIIRYDLRRSDLPDDWQRDFIALLGRGDLVKFAKWTPEDSIAYSDLEKAIELLTRGAIREGMEEAETAPVGRGAMA